MVAVTSSHENYLACREQNRRAEVDLNLLSSLPRLKHVPKGSLPFLIQILCCFSFQHGDRIRWPARGCDRFEGQK